MADEDTERDVTVYYILLTVVFIGFLRSIESFAMASVLVVVVLVFVMF